MVETEMLAEIFREICPRSYSVGDLSQCQDGVVL